MNPIFASSNDRNVQKIISHEDLTSILIKFLRLIHLRAKFNGKFFLRRLGILQILGAFGPLIRNIVVASRGAVPFRSCAVSNVPVENV